jgi:DNA-binding transcriptional ArsR family regulator/DNA-binding CsgD family transcriptional regulator
MGPDPNESQLAVLGLAAAEERLYRLLLRTGPTTVKRLVHDTPEPADRVRRHLERLGDVGLVDRSRDTVSARPPAEALPRLVEEQTRRLRSESERLDAVRHLVPLLSAEHAAATAPTGEPVSIERVAGGDVAEVVRALAVSSRGDLLWLRPDRWRLDPAPRLDAIVKDRMAAGRRSRAIYPARVLEEAPHVIRDRADAGEHVRIMAEVPLRLAVLGRTAALIDERFGAPGDYGLVVRQDSLVGTLALLFECLWEKAMPVPGLDGQGDVGDASSQRLLLGQLAGGAKDEQIARVLGVSLRTVRRRVAYLLTELGADSRFQAGVEAVRRGWL